MAGESMNSSSRLFWFCAALVIGLNSGLGVLAIAKPETPTIDAIRKEIAEQETDSGEEKITSEDYARKIKERLVEEDSSNAKDYSKKIQNELQENGPAAQENFESYSKEIKKELPDGSPLSTIAEVKAGRTELDPVDFGSPNSSIGFRVGASLSNEVQVSSAAGTGNTLTDVYENTEGWYPDISVFYDWYPFYSQYLGNLGFRFGAGLIVFRGFGRFEVTPANNLNTFEAVSRTEFRFAYLPLEVSANYRFNLFHFLKPSVQVGALIIPYQEERTDAGDTLRGLSTSLLFSGGVSLLLDWLSGRNRASLYRVHSIKSTYLNIEYRFQQPLTGSVDFSTSGLYAGFSFDI